MRIRRLLRCFLPRSDPRERVREARLGDLGIVVRLQMQPPAVRKPEEAAQPQIGVRGDGMLAGQDLAEALSAFGAEDPSRPSPCENSSSTLAMLNSTSQIALYSTIDPSGIPN